MALYLVRVGIAAPCYESNSAALYISDCAINHKVPLGSEPQCGEVEVGPVKGRRIVIQNCGHAVRFLTGGTLLHLGAIRAIHSGRTFRGEATATRINIGIIGGQVSYLFGR